MRKWILPLAFLLAIAIELLRMWFLMPFPGSQERDMVAFSFFMHKQIWWMRLILFLVIAQECFHLAVRRRKRALLVAGAVLLLYAGIAYFMNFRIAPSRIFEASTKPLLVPVADNKVHPGKLVIGVEINGEAVAYPIEIIGYHHQVRDIVGRKEILVTYCTACRSGRVFDPVVDGQTAYFRLVGMDRYNAIFEDDVTGSWWMQATGEAVAGDQHGTSLPEIPAQQVTLQKWLEQYPDSKILQADPKFLKRYGQLTGFDEGNNGNEMESRNQMPWQEKSWVVVAEVNGMTRAYDWGKLEQEHIIQDTLNRTPIAITLDLDGKSFYAFSRRHNDRQYQFMYDDKLTNALMETTTNTRWSFAGKCFEGPDSSVQLQPIPVYQEFFHTYETFRK